MSSNRNISFDSLPDAAMLRQVELLGTVPFSASTLWRKVSEGSFPAPIKLGPRITAWKVSDVRAYLASCASNSSLQKEEGLA